MRGNDEVQQLCLGDALSFRASPLKKTIHRIVFLIHPLRSALRNFSAAQGQRRGLRPSSLQAF